MKNLLFLCVILTFQASFAQWEKTSWRSDPYFYFGAIDQDRILLIGHTSGDLGILKLSNDGGGSWKDISIKNTISSIYSPTIIGNTILLPYSGDSSYCYVSTDLGKTWLTGFPNLPLQARYIGFEILGDDIFVALTGEKGGVYRSKDYGVTWSLTTAEIPKENLQSLSKAGAALLLKTQIGYFLSTDKGGTWLDKTGQISEKKKVVKRYSKSDSLYVITTKGVEFSSDFGATWISISNTLPESFYPKRLVCLNDCIVLTSEGDLQSQGENQMFVTFNNGNTWIERANIPCRKDIYSLWANWNKLILTSGDSLYFSEDYGESWRYVSNDSLSNGYGWGALHFYKSNIYRSIGNQLYVSIDSGRAWSKLYGGLNYGGILQIETMGDTLYAISGNRIGYTSFEDAVYSSTDIGASWNPIGLKKHSVERLNLGAGKLFVKTQTDAFISFNYGYEWKEVKKLWPHNYYFDFAAFTSWKIFSASYFTGIEYSLSDGESWVRRNSGLPIPGAWLKDFKLYSDYLYDILYARVGDRLYISFKDGSDWNELGLDLKEFDEEQIRFDVNKNEIYLSTRNRLFYSNDNGQSWKDLSKNLDLGQNDYILALKIISKGVILSIYDKSINSFEKKGIYFSDNNGESWKQINYGLENNLIRMNAFAEIGDYLFCGSDTQTSGPDGDAIYRAKISDFLSAPDEAGEQRGFTVFPNPAADYITIKNAKDLDVVEIFDLYGQPVLTARAADHLDISAFASGVYYVRVGGVTQKLLKVR